jgi:branched-chain amino acid aminotransferase
LITPPVSAGALEGITQHTIMALCQDLGFEVVCDNLARSDVYIADEMFLVGTAAEVSSVNSVDDPIKKHGPFIRAFRPQQKNNRSGTS